MKYTLLVCGDDTADASAMAPVEPWVEDLGDRRVRLHGHRLALPADAVTVRVRGGRAPTRASPWSPSWRTSASWPGTTCCRPSAPICRAAAAGMEEAAEAYRRSLELVENDADRRFLEKRLAECRYA